MFLAMEPNTQLCTKCIKDFPRRRWLFAIPPRPNAILWLFRFTNIFKFRFSFKVSIRFRVKLDYIRLDSVRLKVLLARLTSGVYMHLNVER